VRYFHLFTELTLFQWHSKKGVKTVLQVVSDIIKAGLVRAAPTPKCTSRDFFVSGLRLGRSS